MTLRKKGALLPSHFKLPCQELLDRFIWNKNFHTWATAQKLWHHFWEVLKTLWTYLLKLLCIPYCGAPLHIHDLAGADAGCASIFSTWSRHRGLKISWESVFVRFPDLYQALQIPKGCIIQKKKCIDRESTNSMTHRLACLIRVELGRGWLGVWLLISPLVEITSYFFTG